MDPSNAPWRALELGDRPNPEPSAAEPRRPDRLVLGLAIMVVAAVGAAFFAGLQATPEITIAGGAGGDGAALPSAGPVAAVSDRPLIVQVMGAVARPGVYRLDGDARVGDAIDAAGGYSPRVAADRAARELNLAAPVADGMAIFVPSRDDPDPPAGPVAGGGGAAGSGAAGAGGTGSGGLIDLNKASSSELETLPGIGPVTAQKIIDARTERPFASVEDFRSRKVVGPATFDKIQDKITVR